MYQKVGKAAIKKDLTNTLAFCEYLDNPEKKFKSIHVAGTNGKGSTSHMLAAICQACGYKVGLYTSPHLKDFRERIKINGEPISEQGVIDFVQDHSNFIDKLKPSFFETTVCMAFDYFASEEVDIAIIETGLGGRLDSTNVITPEISVITNIGMDHTDMLGETKEQIAREKGGIIKPGVPVVIGESNDATDSIFRAMAIDQGSDIFFAQTYKNTVSSIWHSDLGNAYQKHNLSTAMSTILIMRSQLGWEFDRDKVKYGIAHVTEITNFKGRWQIINNSPLTICDTGHNVEAFEYIIPAINRLEKENVFMVLGFVKEKKVPEILALLPKKAHYIFCQAQIPRAMDLEELKPIVESFDLNATYIADVNEAIGHATSLASENDVIFVGGSTFVVAEVDNL